MKAMKKILVLASIAIIALASCAKEQKVQNQIENEETVVLTFASERPQLDPITTPITPANAPTRTEWSTDKIVWSTGDKIRVGYKKGGVWMGQSGPAEANKVKFYASEEVAIDGANASVGTFTVPVGGSNFADPEDEASYQFFAFCPSSIFGATISDPEAQSFTLHTTQTPGNNTFDKSADILVGKSEALSLSGLPTAPIALDWTRLVAHADLTFSNLDFHGAETVNKITLTFNTEAKVAGSFEVNIPSGTAGEGDSNVLVLEGSNITSGADYAEVWACALPVTFTSLDVEVKTDKAIYTRSITGISKTFKKNARNTLTVNMSSANRQVEGPVAYTLYSGAISEGDYIIYYNGKAMKAAVSSNRLQYVEVTPASNTISTNDNSIVWHIAESATSGYWTIYNSAEAKYAAATGSNNQAQLFTSGTDDRSLWEVSGSATYEFINKARDDASSNNKYLRNNGTFGFACYAQGTGGELSLYKKDTRTSLSAPSSVTAAVNGSDDSIIDVTFSTVSGASSYVIVATPISSGSAVIKENVTSSPATIDVVNDGLSYGTEYSISVYAVPSDNVSYKNSDATEAAGTVSTGSQPLDFNSIAELNALLTSTSGDYSGYITDAVVSFVAQTNTAIIKDATGSIMYYKADHGLEQGQTFTGPINVTAVLYNGLYSEITAWDASFSGSETVVAPESVALSSIVGHYSDYQNAYVQVAGLTITSVDGKNIEVTDGANTYVVYDNTGSATCGVGDVITVIGTVTKHGTTEELKVWNANDINVTALAPKAITFTQPSGAAGTAGCAFEVSVAGSPITSGTTVASGTTVTLTATAGTDYEFTSWTVTGATVASATATTTTFVMGTTAVSVSASFSSTSGGDVIVLEEEFDNNSTSDSSSAISSSTFSNFSGATSKAYKSQYGGIKLGTGSAVGYITSKSLNLSNSFTVSFTARKYGTDTGSIQVTVGSVTKSITPTSEDAPYSLSFDAATTTSTVKIGTSSKRGYIDNVVITRHD